MSRSRNRRKGPEHPETSRCVITTSRTHAPSRRYLKPFLGVFAVTAEGFRCSGDTLSEACLCRRTGRHRGLRSSADTQSLTTESDKGTVARMAGSDASSAGYLCLQSQGLRSPVASRPGAAAEPFQHAETATESNEAHVGTRGPQLARDAPAATCLRCKKARLPGIICRRLQITADPYDRCRLGDH
jgi:hypothetical protein